MDVSLMYSRFSPYSRPLLLTLALIAVCSQSPTAPEGGAHNAEPQNFARPLNPGETVSDKLSPGPPHTYAFTLDEGERFRALIDKGDMALAATLCAPRGGRCASFVSQRDEALEVSFVADTAGTHRLEVRSLEPVDAAERPYVLTADRARPATAADHQYDSAASAFSEAEQLLSLYEEGALRQAIAKYLEAASAWKSVDSRRAAASLRAAGDVYFLLSDYKQALAYYGQALASNRDDRDGAGTLDSLNSIGYAYIYLGENQKALGYVKRVRWDCAGAKRCGGADEIRLGAQALNNIGEIYYSLSELKKSLQCFSASAELWTEARDRRGLALAHLNMGYSYTDSGDLTEAQKNYRRSMELWQEVGDRRGEALALTALGGTYSFTGDRQQALDFHSKALRLFHSIGNRQGEAAALNGVGQAYEDMSDYRAALDSYQQALELYGAIGNVDFTALDHYYVGRTSYALGDVESARHSYQRALELSRAVGDRQVEAHVLKGQSVIYVAENNHPEALRQLRQALRIYSEIGDRRGLAYSLNDIGYINLKTGRAEESLTYFRRALGIIRDCQDRRGESQVLYNMALAGRGLGNLDEARDLAGESINIIESARERVDSQSLRTSFFATAHKHYELYIDLLMRLHKQWPDAGYAAAAFLASERARARSLLDTLTWGRPGEGGGRAGLLAQEQELHQRLEAKEEYRTRLLSGGDGGEAKKVSAEIDALLREREALLARIRAEAPRYATLTEPGLVRLEEIQGELRDGNTLLLELSLGDERSYLWVVGKDSLTGHELPGRAELERAADSAYEVLSKRRRDDEDGAASNAGPDAPTYPEEVSALSRMVLGPVAPSLGSQKLLLVMDGALQHIPFDALPAPDGRRVLLADHEVVGLPSASILAAIRREGARSADDAAGVVAVLADPVFDKDDPRLNGARGQQTSAGPMDEASERYLRNALTDKHGGGNSPTIPRLPGSLREAKAIMAVVPPHEGMMAVGFEANRALVTGEALRRYRIIHFATHGVLDSERPEMSGLVLSLVDEKGEPQNGYLRLRDIYNLDLPADLVVLSACHTGLGRNVQGEGPIGLTRGFIYAGSKSVIASLWKVDDAATAELMGHFYSALIKDGLPPAAALRAAKEAVRSQERWRAPYFWAGFVLQGEYEGNFARVDGGAGKWRVAAGVLGGAALLLCAGLYLWRWRRVRASEAR
jgi:CHAT domain-containing protein/tetratricopeptide (TPR) repeat protein